MAMITAVPVSITDEAAARVAELGMQNELAQMIEHTQQAVAGLVRINVVLAQPWDTGDEPTIVIEAKRRNPTPVGDQTGREWGAWFVDAFPPDVVRHFIMRAHEDENAQKER